MVLQIEVIVNGDRVVVEADSAEPMRVVCERALTKTGNTARPATDWELRDVQGTLVEHSRPCHNPSALFFLNLAIGYNG